jgi:hypothetical protein
MRLDVGVYFTREMISCIVEVSLFAPDYEPFRSGTASGVLGGATVSPLKGFFYGYLPLQSEINRCLQKEA